MKMNSENALLKNTLTCWKNRAIKRITIPYKGNPYKQSSLILLLASEMRQEIYNTVMYTGRWRSKEVNRNRPNDRSEFLPLPLLYFFIGIQK